MENISHQKYLREQQYRDADKLSARINLHARFSHNKNNWTKWVFEELNLHEGMNILEAGCGTGALWGDNLYRLPDSIQVTLLDLSPGMIKNPLQYLQSDSHFRFLAADIQALPFSHSSFDKVIANHMLYHVPNIPVAIEEVARLLKPSGVFCATTNGLEHLQELYQLIREIAPSFESGSASAARFGLHNAEQILRPFFSRVEIMPYTDYLWVTETPPLMDYIRTMWSIDSGMVSMDMSAMENLISDRIKKAGGIHIQKSMGVITASHPYK